MAVAVYVVEMNACYSVLISFNGGGGIAKCKSVRTKIFTLKGAKERHLVTKGEKSYGLQLCCSLGRNFKDGKKRKKMTKQKKENACI